MQQVKAKIILKQKLKYQYYRFVLKAPGIAKNALPGQFINCKIRDDYDPLLRRPFSIHCIRGTNIEIIYEVVGPGTQILSQRNPGEYLDIIGPLGNGFDYKSQVTSHKSQVLVAGGMGVAPLIFLAERIRSRSTKDERRSTIILIGAKTKNNILCEKEFKDLGCDVKIATDDGSRGYKGKVTDLLRSILLATCDLRLATIYACGPRPMLKEISVLSSKYDIPAQISLEEHLACGIGACLGCVVKRENRQDAKRTVRFDYARVCKEGPVFNADEIIW